MIPAGVKIFVGLVPINLRWSFDRLASLVDAELGRVARSGALFVFFGKRRTALKILFFDGTGMRIFYNHRICSTDPVYRGARSRGRLGHGKRSNVEAPGGGVAGERGDRPAVRGGSWFRADDSDVVVVATAAG